MVLSLGGWSWFFCVNFNWSICLIKHLLIHLLVFNYPLKLPHIYSPDFQPLHTFTRSISTTLIHTHFPFHFHIHIITSLLTNKTVSLHHYTHTNHQINIQPTYFACRIPITTLQDSSPPFKALTFTVNNLRLHASRQLHPPVATTTSLSASALHPPHLSIQREPLTSIAYNIAAQKQPRRHRSLVLPASDSNTILTLTSDLQRLKTSSTRAFHSSATKENKEEDTSLQSPGLKTSMLFHQFPVRAQAAHAPSLTRGIGTGALTHQQSTPMETDSYKSSDPPPTTSQKADQQDQLAAYLMLRQQQQVPSTLQRQMGLFGGQAFGKGLQNQWFHAQQLQFPCAFQQQYFTFGSTPSSPTTSSLYDCYSDSEPLSPLPQKFPPVVIELMFGMRLTEIELVFEWDWLFIVTQSTLIRSFINQHSFVYLSTQKLFNQTITFKRTIQLLNVCTQSVT